MTGTDPLAELARLIGQNDPFTDTVRRQPQAAAPRMQDDAGRLAPAHPEAELRYARGAGVRRRPALRRRRSALRRRRSAGGVCGPGYADQGYADPALRRSGLCGTRSVPDDVAAAANTTPIRTRTTGTMTTMRRPATIRTSSRTRHAQHQGAYAGAQQHGGGADSDDGYDDPPRRRSRGSSLVTAVVLIGCAMLGTAGAYGYRTYATSSGSKQAPVIIADNAPNKIVPSADQKSARVQDRVGGQGDERLVSREEQPVALPGTSSVPRVVFPSPVQPAPTTTGSTPSASSAQASGGSMDQPKRIRTVPIRPEGGDTSARPSDDAPTRAAPPPRTGAAVAPPQTRTASRDQPLSLDPAAPAQANEAAASAAASADPAGAARDRRAGALPGSHPRLRPARRPTPTATAMAVAIWCRCRRRKASPTRRRHTARCRRNIRSSSRGRRSSGVPISAPKASTIAPWSRSTPATKPFSSVTASSRPVDSALSCGTEARRLDPRGGDR